MQNIIVSVGRVKNNDEPSQTAFTAAAARAAHLIVDESPHIFADTLAEALLGERAEELIGYHRVHGTHVVLAGARAQAVCRSRYTEDKLAASGLTQYVILGAGLDTYAYRSDRGVAVFEVDHPATQRGKRRLLSAAGITIPDSLVFVPVDFETESLAECLTRMGFDAERPAFFSWLGVTMYLTKEAIAQTLEVIAGFAPGTEIVADYMLPQGFRDEAGQTYAELIAPTAIEAGEPWLSYFTPDDLSAVLEAHGFGRTEHVRQRDIAALANRTDSLRPAELSVLVHATLG